MDHRVLELFLGEVHRQAAFAIRAFDDLECSLCSADQEAAWYAIQGFLVSVGNISKLLWPKIEKIPGRGEALRKALDIADDSPISPRTFRNHFEHFDERIETWVAAQETSNLVDSNIVPREMVAGLPEAAFLRNLDPTTLVLSFRGDEYDLRKVSEDVRDLVPKVARRLTNGYS